MKHFTKLTGKKKTFIHFKMLIFFFTPQSKGFLVACMDFFLRVGGRSLINLLKLYFLSNSHPLNLKTSATQAIDTICQRAD